MDVSQYLAWAGLLNAFIIVIVNVIVIAALAIWIWALDIRGRGAMQQ